MGQVYENQVSVSLFSMNMYDCNMLCVLRRLYYGLISFSSQINLYISRSNPFAFTPEFLQRSVSTLHIFEAAIFRELRKVSIFCKLFIRIDLIQEFGECNYEVEIQ